MRGEGRTLCDFVPGSPPTWKLHNERVTVELRAFPHGLCLATLWDSKLGARWSGLAPLTYLATLPGSSQGWRLLDWSCQEEHGAVTLQVSFARGRLVLVESLWLPPDLSIIRRWVELHNGGDDMVEVEQYHFLDLLLEHDLHDSSLELLYVEAFAGHRWDRWDPGDVSFGVRQQVMTAGDALRLTVGAYQQACSWAALRRRDGFGLVFGLEYDGAAEIRLIDVSRVPGARTWRSPLPLEQGVRLTAAPIEPLHVQLEPGGVWRSPEVFLGVFAGEWDAAAHITHALVERYLSPALPDDRFPYVIFNTWGYAWDLTPDVTLHCLEVATEVGAEVFVADYGWARDVGDWMSVPARMPKLEELGRRVHAHGMLFGAWMAFANASPRSQVLLEHPEWAAWPDDWGSFGTRALCLAEPRVREWVTQQVLRVVREYELDYLVHDFELITPCRHPAHSHPPDPSGYHSAQGYNQVLRDLRHAHPQLVVENCQGGGRIMTYAMTKLHDTSITTDGAALLDSLGRRRALYGASYPFPPRYCASYMQEHPTDYACRSCMLGGPWILMDRAADWGPLEIEIARRNIALYKRIRPLFRDARVHHLRCPDGDGWDGLQLHQPSADRGVVLLFRPRGAPMVRARLRGLDPQVTYLLETASGRSWEADGGQLMEMGLHLDLPDGGSEVIFLEARR
ncbi:glycoside hydrolase clan GH-D [Thermobaculum terrenum ATCC BAA-798]|uniref:Glycoside hydrolase clan GH-D n=2 Tax=Thermobaculum TaxID=262406 RepID=D1CI33_THET1|nr:glycoside hydrolase clan GH-D [Thermobaculum terrenum ATCC BAA-798]